MSRYKAYSCVQTPGINWNDKYLHIGQAKFGICFRSTRDLLLPRKNLQDDGILRNYGEVHSRYGFKSIPRLFVEVCW